MCGGCAPATGINSPPEGGVHGPPARFACAVPAAPRALPGRGLAPPDPQGCAPWRAFAHRAPAASVTQPEGFRARVRRWRGWATACGCPCPTPSPWRFSGFWEVSKSWAAQSAAGGSGGVPPVVGRRWATRPRRWAARVQPQAVPAVHGLGEVVHGRPGHRAQRSRLFWLSLTLRTTYRVRSSGPQTRKKPRGERKNKETERKL